VHWSHDVSALDDKDGAHHPAVTRVALAGHLVVASSAHVDDSSSCAAFAVRECGAAVATGSALGCAALQQL
jgi:hypothetical protein